MEKLYLKTIQLVMKHPFTSIMLFISLVIPYGASFFLFDFHRVLILGILGIIGMAVILSMIPFMIWLSVTFLAISLSNKPKASNNTVEFDERPNTLSYKLTVASLSFLLYASISLCVCYFLDLGFGWFALITYAFPILRLIVFGVEYRYLKHKF
ncbi:hypothetical protein G4D82_11885 [Flavobacterium sp. CYK-4]|uniref:hypothetical protein n=1 Tax=Flavobacterium lotistagni TaxID=2709660 RepID=UPI00140A57F6|nr:hypothetical protein [Flavobacterium lotistagni]NHM07925.1 hypothetical protein [Flavobacterium lotistagni]